MAAGREEQAGPRRKAPLPQVACAKELLLLLTLVLGSLAAMLFWLDANGATTSSFQLGESKIRSGTAPLRLASAPRLDCGNSKSVRADKSNESAPELGDVPQQYLNTGPFVPGFSPDDPFASLEKTYAFGEPFVSPSGRKFIAMVITLPVMEKNYSMSRIGIFERAWADAWPGLHIKRQVSYMNSPAVRGMAVYVAFYMGMMQALLVAKDFDYLCMFEDDGVPFPGVTWPNQTVNDLESRLDDLERAKGAFLALGGHGFRPHRRRKPPGKISYARFGLGAYAFCANQKATFDLLDGFAKSLQTKRNKRDAPDLGLWRVINEAKDKGRSRGGFVSTPLLVDHRSGFSNTWHLENERPFEGSREWWKFKKRVLRAADSAQ